MVKTKSQEITLNLIKDIQSRGRRIADFLGEKIIVNEKVFPVDSPFSYSSKAVAKKIPENSGIILDIGTGTGVQSIIAAKKGAKKVIAIDIDENSLKNAEENVMFHKLEKIIEIRKSDLFTNIDEYEKFDLILSNIPLTYSSSEISFKHFLFDPDYRLHEKLLMDAKTHLNQNGKLLIPSGDVANEEKLNELIDKYNYEILKIEEETFQDLKWKLYILRPKLIKE